MTTKKNGVDQQLIRDLAGILNDTNLTEIEVEFGDLKLRVSRHAQAVHAVAAPAPVIAAAAPQVAAAAAPAAPTTTPHQFIERSICGSLGVSAWLVPATTVNSKSVAASRSLSATASRRKCQNRRGRGRPPRPDRRPVQRHRRAAGGPRRDHRDRYDRAGARALVFRPDARRRGRRSSAAQKQSRCPGGSWQLHQQPAVAVHLVLHDVSA